MVQIGDFDIKGKSETPRIVFPYISHKKEMG